MSFVRLFSFLNKAKQRGKKLTFFFSLSLQQQKTQNSKCKFTGANLQGAYLMKGAFPYTDFSNANLSDTLADRAVLVESNFDGAVLARAVLTRSDLTGSSIKGADFTNALVDRAQQIALCRVADGTNPTTGADTRQSLGCGSRRRRLESTPSSAEGPQVSEADKEAFRATLPVYRK
jgi:hypothetical protein